MARVVDWVSRSARGEGEREATIKGTGDHCMDLWYCNRA